MVFVPVKRTPRILLRRAWSVLFLFFYPVFCLVLVFLPYILFRFGFCSGKEDPKDYRVILGSQELHDVSSVKVRVRVRVRVMVRVSHVPFRGSVGAMPHPAVHLRC